MKRRLPSFGKLFAITNISASLEDRARSYLDANCAQCHQPGGSGPTFDGRFETPLSQQNITNFPAAFSLGYDHARVVANRDIWRSVLYGRMNTADATNAAAKVQMPPLARNLIDTNAVELIAKWINSLPGTPALAPPQITPSGGTFVGSIQVSMTALSSNSVIRYTLDGSLPTTNSTLYSAPFMLLATTNVSASAFAPEFQNSVTASTLFEVQPLRFASEEFLSNGVFSLGFIGSIGSNYVLETSSNLSDWTPILTNVAGASAFDLSDPGASHHPRRFYRVIQK